jgi:hypothetical protein
MVEMGDKLYKGSTWVLYQINIFKVYLFNSSLKQFSSWQTSKQDHRVTIQHVAINTHRHKNGYTNSPTVQAFSYKPLL